MKIHFVCFLVALFFSCCGSPKKSKSNLILTTGRTLSGVIDLYKKENGSYPENLKIAIEEYKENLSNTNFYLDPWVYVEKDSSYMLIHRDIADGNIYIFSDNAHVAGIRVNPE